MSNQIVATVVLSSLSLIASSYLEVESNYLKPKLERNNIVNKGLWIRNKGPKNPTEFIFRANSLDVDKILQNNYDSFGVNAVSSSFFNSYIQRKKRSAKDIKEPSTSSLKKCSNNDCLKTNINKSSMIKSKLISTLKPASVFNDYPYEVAVILGNKDEPENKWTDVKGTNHSQNITNNNETVVRKLEYNRTDENVINKNILEFKRLPSSTLFDTTNQNMNITIPKRSMDRHNYETELIKKMEFTEEINDTNNKLDRNVFDKEDMEWRTGPVPNVNVYKVLPKSKDLKHKPITERGLIKVLSMLTKTFKKIMKQHHDIKRIHNTISNLNDDFVKNLEDFTNKYEDINSKYSQILKINEDINLTEVKIRDKEIHFDKRDKELSKNLLELQNQQKKFLNQQKQFYTVQKLMLAQNEKINIKQNLIAKTQSEISHRQNNFARILKKAKQIYIDSNNWSSAKLNTAIVKPKIKSEIEKNHQPIKVFTTSAPLPTTEPVKINLFSIAPLSKIKNHDQKMLEEIDEQPVDELIYKYYFNNTFIDELMKNKILATFIAATEDTNVNNNKNKRNKEVNQQTTMLLPINKTNVKNNIRRRRWIKHSNKNKKKLTTPVPPKRNIGITKIADVGTQTNIVGDLKNMKNDPYVTMAENFCKAIDQTGNFQILKWCIEKALRRLQVIDLNVPLLMPTPNLKKSEIINKTVNIDKPVSTMPILLTTVDKNKQTNNVKTSEISNSVMFFPDNEELENKIKEYELQPDPEGTVYFDGSLHASDLGYVKKNSDLDSEGFSDIMPGLDSNSKVEVDPLAIDLQAQRRANVRRINERILKMRMG